MIKFHCVAEDKYAKLLQNASSSSAASAAIPGAEGADVAQPKTASAISSGEELSHEVSTPKETIGNSKPVGEKEAAFTGHDSSSRALPLEAEKETVSSAADPEPESAPSPEKNEASPETLHEDSPPASPFSTASSNDEDQREQDQKLNTIVDRWIFFEE